MLGFRTHTKEQKFKNGALEDRPSEETSIHIGEQKALPERNDIFSYKDGNHEKKSVRWEKEDSMIQAEEMKDLYTEDCKTLIRGIEEDSSKWKGIPCLD